MPRGKKFTAEQIIGKLREAEVGLAQGKTVSEVVRKLGVTEQTYYRWKREYGGLRTDQAKRLKDLEKENARLKRPPADAELDKAILTNLECQQQSLELFCVNREEIDTFSTHFCRISSFPLYVWKK